MPDDRTTLAELKALVDRFVAEREWRRFHTPKNLAMSIAIEAAELMEHFQWLDPEETAARVNDPARRQAIVEEMADVFSYLLSLASALDVDLGEALKDKLRKNAAKYPADEFRGRFERDSAAGPDSGHRESSPRRQ